MNKYKLFSTIFYLNNKKISRKIAICKKNAIAEKKFKA